MSKTKQAKLLLIILILLGSAVLTYNRYYKKQIQHEQTVSPLSIQSLEQQPLRPDFTLPDRIGLPHPVSEWDGKVLVLNFWASWCIPCRREIPMLTELAQDYDGKGVQLVGIAIDERAAVDSFLDKAAITINYPILIGDDAAIPVAKAYGNEFGVLPYTVIIDRQQHIRHIFFGEITRKQLEPWITSLL